MTTIALPSALIASNPDVLAGIHDPELSVAIWERTVPHAIATLLSHNLRTVRFSTGLEDLRRRLTRALDAADYPMSGARIALETDIADLAERFAAVMRCDRVDIRLDRITGNACRKWHADYVTARLLTTYAGRGTQWIDVATADSCACGDAHDVRELGPGDVAIFKGRHWSEARAAVHRSPPIEGSGEERLLFVINPAEQHED